MSFLLESLNLFLFHPLSFCEQQQQQQQQHTHTQKDIFLLSFSGFLSIFRKRKTYTHTHTKELSGDVLFSFFLLFVVFSPAVCFDVYYLFVCLLLFCFAKVICCSCIAVTKALMQIKYRKYRNIEKKRADFECLGGRLYIVEALSG